MTVTVSAAQNRGGRAERAEEGGYATEEGDDSEEDKEESEWGDNKDGSLGNDSGLSGASTTADGESLMGVAYRTSGTAEDGRGWRRVTRRRGRCGGRNVRAKRKGERYQQTGNRDGSAAAMHHNTGDGNGVEKAWRQQAWDWDRANRAMVLQLASDRAGRRDKGDGAGGRRRKAA